MTARGFDYMLKGKS